MSRGLKVELTVPDLARERAERICRLSHDYSEHGAGFEIGRAHV